jgi:hypothetical protein
LAYLILQQDLEAKFFAGQPNYQSAKKYFFRHLNHHPVR